MKTSKCQILQISNERRQLLILIKLYSPDALVSPDTNDDSDGVDGFLVHSRTETLPSTSAGGKPMLTRYNSEISVRFPGYKIPVDKTKSLTKSIIRRVSTMTFSVTSIWYQTKSKWVLI